MPWPRRSHRSVLKLLVEQELFEPEVADSGRPQISIGEDPAIVAERTDLSPLATFVPSLITDDDGTARATFTLPDSVTRYRITAIATDGAKRLRRSPSMTPL